MKIPSITLKTETLELGNLSPEEFCNSIHQYLIKAPSNSSPGSKIFVSGEVNITDQEFIIYPIVHDAWNRVILLNMMGKVSDRQIQLRFVTPITSLVIPVLCNGFFLYILLSEGWREVAWLTLPFSGLLFIIGFLFSRRFYRKDLRNHIEFITKMNPH
ncbi:hypothetical protein [Roseivirga echinicomitans]|uniref:hypothetical protein n=1 Tax=Roseivirga echinicomitans TaxID=296218 RepID=UPI000A50C4C9|nr:hypothetical protein [Roseivirga echinicomitans]